MAGARKLVATEEFDILGGTERELAARRKQQQEEEARGSGLDFLGSSLINMFGPPKDSVGVRLLRKMGWRPGQGIGPRVRRRIDQEKEEEEEDNDEDNDALNDITFAPRDTPIENFQAKRDTYGLGFDLSSSVPEVAEMKRLRELARQKEMSGEEVDRKNRSSFGVIDNAGRKVEAFGLGALEDDEDEEDVYRTDTTNYHTSLYDDEGGLTKDQMKMQLMKRKRQQMEEVDQSKHLLKYSDGRPPLKGFHVTDKTQQIGKWHAPPKVPADFTGQHVVKTEQENNETNAPKISKESLFSFEERGNALGEKPIEQRSVFDYMPKHSKDKLDQAVSYFIDIGKDKSQLSEFPTIPKDVAKLALQGFMPFGDNLKKQARYRSYLENQAGMLSENGIPKTVLPIPEGLTYEIGMKETDEFAKAARIFRPISAMMSGRFTSASETSKNVEVVNFEGGLKTEEQYRKEKEQRIKETPKPEKKQLSQEAEAAAMKMFGNLTRTVKPFYPNRLVCKRFNVKDPHPNHDHTADKAAGRTQSGNKDALSKESMETILNERLPLQKFTSVSEMTESLAQPDDDPMMKAVVPKPSQRSEDSAAPTTGIETAKKEENEDEDGGPPLDYERPSMDIFKAIFDDSDLEDEEEEEVEEKRENNKLATITTTTTTTLNQDDFIGPPMPPKPATADIPITTSSSSSVLPKDEPFRPMFKRASERKDQSTSSLLPEVISEQVVVQPFKPRSSRQKRRQINVFDDEEEEEEEEEKDEDRHKKRERSRNRSRSRSPSRSRDRKSSSKRRSKSRRDKDDERESRHGSSSSKRHRDSKKRKSESSSSSSRHKHHKSSRHNKQEQDDLEAFWVEKAESSNVAQKSDKTTKIQKGGRMSAADMW
jgi:G patch domain-containing protein 1